VQYQFGSFDGQSQTNNLGSPPVYTADFGGNLDQELIIQDAGSGTYEFTVAGTARPGSATASVNLAANGSLYF
jgi:hypothetical protein